MPRRWSVLIFLVLLSACQPASGSPAAAPDTVDAAPVAESVATQTLEADAQPTPVEVVEEAAREPEPPSVTVWMPELFGPSGDTPAGEALVELLGRFDDEYPEIQVNVETKRITGSGSVLEYLRAAPGVAPAVIPDLVLVNRDALLQAHNEGLLIPIGDLLEPAVLDDLYPVAVDLGTVDATLVGLTYFLDVEHIVYRQTLFAEPPNTLEAVLESPVLYDFPAGPAGSVNDTILIQYLAAGGTLVTEDGTATIDEAVLNSLLEFYVELLEAELLDTAAFGAIDPAESWARYRDRQSGLAATTSTLYLSERDLVSTTTGLSAIPTISGSPFTLATGWMWVITTPDPDRQQTTLTLLDFLLEPTSQGVYTQAASWLPSQPAALTVWGDADRYVVFGDQLLLNAQPLPDDITQSAAANAVQEALESVILNETLPVQAVSEAMLTLNPDANPAP